MAGSGGGAGNASTVPTAAEFSDAYKKLVCAPYAACCDALGKDPGPMGCELLLPSPGGKTYDPDAGQACLDKISQAMSGSDLCAISPTEALSCPDLAQAKPPTRNPGESCDSLLECVPSTEGSVDCRNASGSDAKYCVVQVRGKEGDGPCTVSFNEGAAQFKPIEKGQGKTTACYHNDGLFCGAEGKCIPLVTQGKTCDPNIANCVDDLFCSLTDGLTCRAPKPDGAQCFGLGKECAGDSRCLYVAGKLCGKPKEVGSACASGGDCLSNYCVEKLCSATPPSPWALFCGLGGGPD